MLFNPLSKYCIAVVIVLSLLSNACKKDKQSPLSKLPPLTTTGENTFGCLVNGGVFKPKRSGITPVLQASYQQLYVGNNGFALTIAANHFNSSCDFAGIRIDADSVRWDQNGTYDLVALGKGNFTGRFVTIKGCDDFFNPLYTSVTETGQLHISFLDTVHQIVSGTFFFDVKDTLGNVYHITDGRFDLRYVR